ncbi:MAG: lactate racemase domain-containing protein [Gaiella sp.]|nr:lactate racemase domain-containing protein [Gaiella sp.]
MAGRVIAAPRPGAIGCGTAHGVLRDDDVLELLTEALAGWDLDGRRVACVVPDATRTAPMPFLHRAVSKLLEPRVGSLEWLIALGTHQPMRRDAIARHLGLDERDAAALARVRNHEWREPDALVEVGTISAQEVEEISGGLLAEAVPVRVNRRLLEHDVAIVVGPVFPHEVVGFSGGNKYFFPGLSGQELIDVSHWLGALHTSSAVIGTLGTTPIRRLIDRAAAFLPIGRRCVALVVRPSDARLHGVYLGGCEDAWAAAAALSSRVHVSRVEEPFDSVLAVAPPMYADLWTAAKGVYKLEPVVADGGELVLHAPHVTSFSTTHGRAIAQVGYHCRDYFLAQRDRFAGVPLGVLAHSTHVRGLGTYEDGVERCRISVTLATGIPREECERAGLGYADPAAIDPTTWAGRGRSLVVEHAGEVLYRLATP